jgi:hypothetical protein
MQWINFVLQEIQVRTPGLGARKIAHGKPSVKRTPVRSFSVAWCSGNVKMASLSALSTSAFNRLSCCPLHDSLLKQKGGFA